MCPLFYFYRMSMRITYTGGPSDQDVITLADLKSHLRVEHNEDDTLITGIRATAIQYVEDFCAIKLGNHFGTGYLESFEPAYFTISPIASISAVEYKATGYTDTLSILESSKYFFDINTTPHRISFVNTPSLAEYQFNRVQVTMNVGHSTDNIPAGIISAIKLITGHLYEHRTSEMMNLLPHSLRIGVEALLNPHRTLFQP